MKMNWKFAVAGILAIIASTTAIAEGGRWQGSPAPNAAVLYRFANVSNLPTLAEGPVKETCSHYAVPAQNASASKTKPPNEDEQVKLADAVNKELAKRLGKKMSVSLARPADIPAAGSLVFTGCFVGADPINAARHLSAHVRVFYVGASGPVSVEEFDLAVKSYRTFPSVGVFGVSDDSKEILDAKKLADDILKRLKKDHLV